MPVFLIPAIAAALPAVGPIALAGAAAGYAATTYAIATVLAYAVTTAATLGASYLLNQPKKQKGDPQQVSVKQSLPARTRSYGRVKIAGAYAFHEVYLGALYQIHIHGDGEWDGVDEWWLNDKNTGIATAGGGPVAALPWGSNVRLETHLGTPTQSASPAMMAAFGPSGVWTANHQLKGLAYSVLILGAVKEKVFGKVYPNGVPAPRLVARTAKVYDPRTSTVAFSENPALCTRDYLTHPRGFSIPAGMIDDASFSTFANICDQAVALAAGGTESRYRVGFTYDLTQEPREVLRTLLSAADAEIYPTASGKVGIRGGAWEAPTVTLDAQHILTYRYTSGNDRLAAFNKLKLTFTHREADYQPVEIDPWEDLASQAEVGVLSQDLTLQQVPSFTQARRLGKIFSAKANPRHRLTMRTNLGGLLALGERCVRVKLDDLEIDETFFVERFELSGDLSGCDLQLASLSSAAYTWTTAEEGAAPTPPPDSVVAAAPPTPTGLTLTLMRVQIMAGVWASKVRATVNTVAGAPWQTVGRYRRVGDSTWIDMVEDGDWATITPDALSNDVFYEFQAAHTGWGGINSSSFSAWTATQTIEVVSDPSLANLLPHSDDPDAWIATRGSLTSGALVSDPLGGTRGRALTFGANAGFIYTDGLIGGTLAGRTFTLSVYLRAPAGKTKIMFIGNTNSVFSASEVSLTGSWQRVTKTITAGVGDAHIRLWLDNTTGTGITNNAAGVVEVFGGMIQERASASTYKSAP